MPFYLSDPNNQRKIIRSTKVTYKSVFFAEESQKEDASENRSPVHKIFRKTSWISQRSLKKIQFAVCDH